MLKLFQFLYTLFERLYGIECLYADLRKLLNENLGAPRAYIKGTVREVVTRGNMASGKIIDVYNEVGT